MSCALVAGFLALSLSGASGIHAADPNGYLAAPKSGHGRGVLVLHAWWGLNGDVKTTCNRLAEAGYVAFAPDLFEGKTATTVEGAKGLVKEFNPKDEELKKEIEDSTDFLSRRTGGKTIAVLGFSFGSNYALWLSNDRPDLVRSVVVYYGTGPEDFGKSKAAYLGNFAEKDEFEPLEGVRSLEKLLRKAGRPVTFHVYPGTGHWFAEPGVTSAFDRSAADLAWSRTLRFLKENLKD